jgi:hypothetical protein
MTRFGKIIANTRPNNVEIYLDGIPILDSEGQIAKTPTIILNVSEGAHNITFSKSGYDSTTIMVNVREGLDTDARAILATKFMRYPNMLSSTELKPSIESSQPAPGWPALPIPQIPYGYLVANTIPDGAEIYIDGQPIFDTVGKVLTTPASILGIVIGRHTVTFRKKGYSDTNIDVFIENGLYSDAYAVLRPIMIGSKPIVILGPAKGEITVDTTPAGAQIYINSKLMVDDKRTPIRTPVTLTLNEGWYDLGVYLEKYCREFSPIYIYPNAKTYIHRDLYSPPCV